MSKKTFLDNMNMYFVQGKETTTNIYFIVNVIHKNKDWLNRIKIGFSDNIDNRIASMQTGNPYPLKVWYSFKIEKSRSCKIEKSLHAKFKWCRESGEWFYIRACIREWIALHKSLTIHYTKNKPKCIKRKQQVVSNVKR